MPTPNQLHPDIIRRLISYNHETGILTWKSRDPSEFQCREVSRSKVCNGWNTKYSGNPIVSAMHDGRRIVHINLGKRVRTQAARIAWVIHYGDWPKGIIDHIDGDCTNDRIDNLRDVSGFENNRNQRIGPRNTSGKVGVTFFKRTGKWRAWISVSGRVKSLGYFYNLDDAIAARVSAENRYGFFEATRISEALKYEQEFAA